MPAPNPSAIEQALSKFTIRENRDALTNDILVDGKIGTLQPDLGACAMQCDRKPACKGFSFDHWVGKCYMKDNIVLAVLDPRSSIAVKKSMQVPAVSNAPNDIEIIRNRRVTDEPAVRRRVFDLQSCKAICNESMSCVAFTFLKQAHSGAENCLMFKTSKQYSSDSGADTGIKFQSR